MTPDEQMVYDWFSKYGVVHEIKADPRGKYWVSGYLPEITAVIIDQKNKARKEVQHELSGHDRGGASSADRGATEARSSQVQRSVRKRPNRNKSTDRGSKQGN